MNATTYNQFKVLSSTKCDATPLQVSEEFEFDDSSNAELLNEDESNIFDLRMKQKEKYRKERRNKRISPRDHKGVLHAAPAKHSAHVEDSLVKKKKQLADVKRDEHSVLNEIVNSYEKVPMPQKALPWDDLSTVVNIFKEISAKYQSEFTISFDTQCSLEAIEKYLEDSTIQIAYYTNRIEECSQDPISGFCLIVPENLFYLTQDDVVKSALYDTAKYLWALQ